MAGILFFLSALGSYYPEFLFFEHGVPSYSLLVRFQFLPCLGRYRCGAGFRHLSDVHCRNRSEQHSRNTGVVESVCHYLRSVGGLLFNFLILGSHANPVIDLVNGVNQIMNPEAAAWTTETGWRLMFVSEAVPAGLFALLVLLVPETPRYLAMCGKDERALNVLESYQRRFSEQR